MIGLKKILVPIDFTEHSKLAARKAISLAQVCDATLYFLNVGETAQKSAKALCSFLHEVYSKHDVNMKKLVAQGKPATMVLTTARKLDADAIIMGHRGLSALKHLVKTSVGEEVLRESLCPVIIIKKQKPVEFDGYVLPQLRNIEEAFQADKILVPLDFSSPSKEAFRYAAYLASRYNSIIYTLTVFDKKYREIGEDRKKHTAVIVHKKKIRLWEKFPELLKTATYNGKEPHIKRILLDGDPSSRIESVVEQKEIDLVIMGTNGRTGLEHFFVGSVAEKVLRSVNCPVMTIRAKRQALYIR